MISDAHQRLREATRDDHQRLEDSVQILTRIGTLEGRRGLVVQFHSLHAEVEAAIAPWLANIGALDFAARRRTSLLERDIAALGTTAARCGDDPVAVGSRAEALGMMYVLEGSTLGGRVIRRNVETRGGDMRGLSFLDPYGERVGERWKSFLAVLAGAARTPADTDALLAGARAGFRHAERRLSVETANA